MGYTHHWTQTRDFDEAEFAVIGADVAAILACATDRHGIVICDASADPDTNAEITDTLVGFNGTDRADLGNEGFVIERVRTRDDWRAHAPFGWSFCKTARKPYDRAVTAVLCYLASVVEAFDVGSDGRGADFIDGLALARDALPQHCNRLDIPRTILEEDRWCPPRVSVETDAFSVRFCVDGHAYVLDGGTGASYYRFASHDEASSWLAGQDARDPSGAALFGAVGWIDGPRRRALATAQERVLASLIAGAAHEPAELGRDTQPPALVRPDEVAPRFLAQADPIAL